MSESIPTFWNSHTALLDPHAVYDGQQNAWLHTSERLGDAPVLMGVNTATAVYTKQPGYAGGSTVAVETDTSAVYTYGVFTYPSQPSAHTMYLNPVPRGTVVASGANLVLASVPPYGSVDYHRIFGFNGMNGYVRTLAFVSGRKFTMQNPPGHPHPLWVHANVGVAAIVAEGSSGMPAVSYMVGFRANPGELFCYLLPWATLTADDRVLLGANVVLLWKLDEGICAFGAGGGQWAALAGTSPHSDDVCLVGTNVAVVIQPAKGLLHAFSGVATLNATPFTWQTRSFTPGAALGPSSVSGNVALVAVPGDGCVFAFSAVTGDWSSTAAGNAPATLGVGQDAVSFLAGGAPA